VAVGGTFHPPAWPYNSPPPLTKASKPENPEAEELVSAQLFSSTHQRIVLGQLFLIFQKYKNQGSQKCFDEQVFFMYVT
jgi:hypothetical protein